MLFASVCISKVTSTFFIVALLDIVEEELHISASWLCAGDNLLMQDKNKQLIFPVPICHVKHEIWATDGGRSLRIWRFIVDQITLPVPVFQFSS